MQPAVYNLTKWLNLKTKIKETDDFKMKLKLSRLKRLSCQNFVACTTSI